MNSEITQTNQISQTQKQIKYRYKPKNKSLFGVFIPVYENNNQKTQRLFDPVLQIQEEIIFGYFEHNPKKQYFISSSDLEDFYFSELID